MENKMILSDCFSDYCEMTKKSWTYQKLTKDEKVRCLRTLDWANGQGMIKGNYNTRWRIMNAIYYAFLNGLEYCDNPVNWRS